MIIAAFAFLSVSVMNTNTHDMMQSVDQSEAVMLEQVIVGFTSSKIYVTAVAIMVMM